MAALAELLPCLEERLALYGGPAYKRGPGKDPECLKRPVLEPPTERELRGRPFDGFVQEWSRKRPKDVILKYYGQWPIPHGP